MIGDLANSFLEAIGAQLKALFGPLFGSLSDYVYISEWWLGFVVILGICGVAGFFLPFKWVRAGLGFIVWTALIAAWVATVVWKHMRNEKKPPAPKLNPAPRRQATQDQQRSGWP